MKKVLLFVFALTLSAGMYAQKPQVLPGFAKKAPAPFHQQVASEPIGTKPVYMAPVVQSPSSPDGPNAVSIIDLGTSINPFGMSGAGRTVLWADNQINAIGFVHRMNGDVMAGASIAFDLSKDGGASWSNNIKVYAPLGPPLPGQTYPQAAGRYPQGCLYNPAGNTDPRNAYMHYFIPTLDGSNPGSAANAGSWGGYAFGVRKADTIPPYTQHNVPSGNGYLHNIPDAFALVGNKTFIVEPSLFGGLGTNYSDSLVVSKGVWNATTNDFDYTFDKLYVPCDWYVTDSRIAFAPNGQIGYISILSHNTSKPLTDSTYFPILYKTINGGTTWTGPINVDLYGTNGVPEVKQYVSDSLLTAMFTTMPDRDSIAYGTIGASDLNVDVNGNPHIACVVNLASGTYTTYYPKTCQMFDIYSPDGGTTWKGISLDTISNEWGTYGTGATTVSDDNRPQISRSEDGSRMFISWLDTQPPTSPAANTAPNIFVRGINVWTSMMTPVLNVTKFTLAYTQAYMATQSFVVFQSTGGFGIPFVYQAMNPTDATQPVQFKYIHNYKIMDSQFTLATSSNVISIPTMEVSQNYPNPCHGLTTIGVELEKSSTVSVQVYNLVGQKIMSLPAQTMSGGIHEINLDLTNTQAGIYFYTVTIGKQTITKKMVVR